MAKDLNKAICGCGNCETAVFRALGVVEKMMLDEECSQYIVAVGIAMSAIGSHILNDQMMHAAREDGMPELIAQIACDGAMRDRCNAMSNTIRHWYEANKDPVMVEAIDKIITKANDKHIAEQNLPKGD